MNRTFKINSLVLLLLAITTQTIQCCVPDDSRSYCRIAIEWIFGYPQQPQSNTDQAPAGVTAQDYITQFRYDLNGSAQRTRTPVIPWDEVDEMEAAIKQELNLIDIRDTDTANNLIWGVICNQVRTKTILDLQELEREGFYVAPEDYKSIPNSHEENIRVRLIRAPHLNGESIAQYFGSSRKTQTKNALFNHHQNYDPYSLSRETYR